MRWQGQRQWRNRRLHKALRVPLRAHRLGGRFLGRVQHAEDRRDLQEEAASSHSPPCSDRNHFREMVRAPIPRPGYGAVGPDVQGEVNLVLWTVVMFFLC